MSDQSLLPPPEYAPLFEQAAERHGVPREVLMAIAQQESTYNPEAVGEVETKWGRAKGMMQYIDRTASNLGIDPFDPAQAVDAAAAQLAERLRKGDSLEEAIAHHHSGPNRKIWGKNTADYIARVSDKARRIAGQAPTSPSQRGSDNAFANSPTRNLLNDWEREAPKQGLPTMPGQPAPAEAPPETSFATRAGEDSYGVLKSDGNDYQREQALADFDAQQRREQSYGVRTADAENPWTPPQYDSVWEATKKAVGNVPENMTASAGGMLQLLGEDFAEFSARQAAIQARRLGVSEEDVKLLYALGKNGVIDEVEKNWQGERPSVPELVDYLKTNLVPELSDEQAQQFADAKLITGEDLTKYGQDLRRQAQADMHRVNAEPGSMAHYGSAAIASTAEMAPALVAGMLTRSPGVAMSIIGGQVGGESYAAGRDEGLNPEEARTYALAQAAAEAIPSALPISAILKPGQGFFRRLGVGAVTEGIQETLTAALQAGIDKGMVSPDMTWEEARQRMIDGGIVGTLAGSTMAGGVHGVERGLYHARGGKAGELAREFGEAVKRAEFVDNLNQIALDRLNPTRSTGPVGRAMSKTAERVAEAQADAAERVRNTVQGVSEDEVQHAVQAAAQDQAPGLTPEPVAEPAPATDLPTGRVAVETPTGAFNGTVEETSADGRVRVLSDEGMMYEFGPQDRVVIRPEADLAQAEAAVPQSSEKSEQSEPAPSFSPEQLAQMREPELRTALKTVAQAIKADPQNPELKAQRKAVERAINEREWEEAAQFEQALTEGRETFELEPTPELDIPGWEAEEAALAERQAQAEAPAKPEPVTAPVAEADPSPSPSPSAEPVKWFGSKDKAEAWVAKQKTGQFAVRQEDRRFNVYPVEAADGAVAQNAPADSQSSEKSETSARVLKSDGSPFASRETAERAAKNRRLDGYAPVAVEGGWALEKADLAQQQETTDGLPPTEIRIGDSVIHKGQEYTVSGGVDGGIVATRVSRSGGIAQESSVILKGPDATRARLASIEADAASQVEQARAEVETAPTEAQKEAGEPELNQGQQKTVREIEKRIRNHNQEPNGPNRDAKGAAITKALSMANLPAAERERLRDMLESAPAPKAQAEPTPAGFEVDAAIKVSAKEADQNGGQYRAVARRLAPWSVSDAYGQTPEEAQQKALRKVGAFKTAQTEPAAAPQTPKADQPQADAEQFANNTVFTADAVAAARARLKKKLGQLNSGIDPEIFQDGITITGAYIEAGVRNFRDYARAMVADFGDRISPYLLTFWEGVRHYPGFDKDGMTSPEESAAIHAQLLADPSSLEPPAVEPEADPAPAPRARQAKAEPSQEPDDLFAETTEESPDESGADAASDDQPLADVPPLGRPEIGQGPATTSDGLSAADPSADGQLEDDRSRRGDRLDGEPQSVLPGAAAEPRPAAAGPLNRKEDRPHQLAGDNPGNFSITEDFGLGEGADGQKIKANLDALRTLRRVQAEGRFPTPAEQATMARYVGWGGLKSVFDVKKADSSDQYGRAQRELKELLSSDEYNAAFDSVRNAHYTAQGVVDAMWRMARHMGFRGGRALEPTVGIGNFLGLQPDDMAAATEWHAAELDSVTGQMAALLYPEANVLAGTGFQAAPFADNVFDLAIGNPPFGAQTIRDKSKQRGHLDGMKVHNYIIAKTGMHLRPGGVMAMVVTHRFLDTANPEARKVLAKEFNFLGAIRLPNDAFAANAGTEVVTDVIFLQKRAEGEAAGSDAWLDTSGHIEIDGKPIRVNRYFQEHPNHILGRSAMDGTMYANRGRRDDNGEGEYTVHGDGRDLGQAIDALIAGDFAHLADILTPDNASRQQQAAAMLTQSDLPVGGMRLSDEGEIEYRDLDDAMGNAVIRKVTPDSLWKDQAAQWQAVVDAVRELRDAAKEHRLTEATVAELREVARFAYKADGTAKASPTKAEQAIYDIVAATARPDRYQWSHGAQLNTLREALSRKQLGEDGYQRLRGMLDLRNRTLALIEAEMTDAANMETLRRELNEAYDGFVKQHGFLSEGKNAGLLDGDIGAEAGLEASFEPAISKAVAKSSGVPARKASAQKADILKQRVNFPRREISTAANPGAALDVSLSERGRVDIGYMAALLKQPADKVIAALSEGDSPRIFRNPETDEYEDAETYLSGNVRHKLHQAKRAGLKANVKALEAAQPAPKTQAQVKPNIRGQWIPAEVFEDFLRAMGVSKPAVRILASQGMMKAEGGVSGDALTEFGAQFRHPRKNVLEMFNAAAAGKSLVVWDKDADGNAVKNDNDTKEVNAIAERMGKVFAEFAYADPERAARIVDAFNEKMNTHTPRTYNGEKYLVTVGANPSIQLRRTQKNAAWRMILDQTVLLDHVVGAGKTFTLITGIMERRRLGLSRKPMIAVPNHLVVQWARDFYKLYPGAKVLAATPADFAKKNRRRLFARIATGDYDAIIVGHTSIGFMENAFEDQKAIIDENIKALEEAMAEARRSGESKRTLGQMRDRLEKYQDKLKALADRATDDIGINFKALGVDYLAVDEAHEFKNLEYATSGERVVGMNDPNGSKRAFDLYVKVRGLLGREAGVAFATGTPVSNSLVEVYTVMRYLAHEELVRRDQAHFDAWSGAYAATETRLEYTATQKLKPRRVLAGLNNLSALRQLYEQFADIITMGDLKRIYSEEKAAANKKHGTNERTEFPVPKVKGGKRQLNSAEITAAQREYMDYLVARMGVIEQNKGDKEYARIDNPLNVLTDARKMSLDIRVVDPTLPRDDNGKVMRSARRIKAIYDQWNADRGTQLVFCDLSTPAKAAVKDARKLIGDTAKKLFGESQAKEVKRRLAEQSFDAQWRWLKAQADELVESQNLDPEKREEIEAYFNGLEDAEATILTADIGFSVYDDLRSVLEEMGVPATEIAFIHDYNTPEQKEKLFDRVNNGYVRVLIGSSAKMGAGTNAQRRLVALHHLDAPWRPSDVEQREGRIIRQGNMFYERDPDGFEVDITAYSTNGTSDTVMWQILERKAGGIEQFRNGELDELQEDAADSDQYAEFMASSTGNPVFRYKLEAERVYTELQAEIGGKRIAKANALDFLDRFPRTRRRLIERGKVLDGPELKDSATLAEAARALAKAEADYDAAYAEWLPKRDAANAAIAAWEKAPEKTRGKKPPMPVKPPRPTLLSKEVQAQSQYARKIAEALKQLKGSDTGGDSIAIDIAPGLAVAVTGRASFFSDTDPYWTATLIHPHMKIEVELERVQGKRPENSPNFLRALSPAAIEAAAADQLAYDQRELKRLEAQQPEQEKLAGLAINESKLNEARELMQWYQQQVSFAETRADIERSARSNRFVANDRRRFASGALRTLHKAEPVERLEIDGAVYETSGISSGPYYEATRERDGLPVVLEKKRDSESKEDYYAVALEQPKAARGQTEAQTKPKPTPARSQWHSGWRGNDLLRTRPADEPRPSGVAPKPGQRIVGEFLQRYPGADDIKVQVHRNQREFIAARKLDPKENYGRIMGSYSPRDNTVHLVGANLTSERELINTLQHEILVHKGLGFFQLEDRIAFIQAIADNAPKSPSLRPLWEQIERSYEGKSDYLKAEELLALLAERKLSKFDQFVNRIIAAAKALLAKAGFIEPGISKEQLIGEIYRMGEAFAEGKRAGRRAPREARLERATQGGPADPDIRFSRKPADLAAHAAGRQAKGQPGAKGNALAAAIKGLSASQASAARDYDGGVMRDMSRVANWVQHPYTVASLHKEFTPVFLTAQRQGQMRDAIIAELYQDYRAYRELPKASRERVNKVLELGRLLQRNYREAELVNGIRNPGTRQVVDYNEHGEPLRRAEEIHAALSQPGEVIELSQDEQAAYRGLRKLFDEALGRFADQVLVDLGLEQFVGEADRAQAIIDTIDPATMKEAEVSRLISAAETMAEIEQAKRTGYVPLSRYGRFAITVKEQKAPLEFAKNPEGGWIVRNVPAPMEEFLEHIGAEYSELEGGWQVDGKQRQALQQENTRTVYSEKIEIHGLKNRFAEAREGMRLGQEGNVLDIPQVREAYERIKRDWVDGHDNRTLGRPFDTHRQDPQGKLKLSELDALADIAALDAETWAEVREQFADAIKGRGFRKHFFHSDNVPGYTTDFERAIGDYIGGMAGHLARRHHERAWEDAVGKIRAPRLGSYAREYRDYVNDPQEEYALLRQTGFLMYIAGNLSTAFLNSTQPFIMTGPALAQVAPQHLVAREMAAAYKDALAMTSRKKGLEFFDPTKALADVRAVLTEAWEEGQFAPMFTHEVMGKTGHSDKDWQAKYEKGIEYAAFSFTYIERLNRLVSFIAAARLAAKPAVKKNAHRVYANNQLAKRMVLGENWSAKHFAEFIVDESQFMMGKANRAKMLRSHGALIFQFFSFVSQSLQAWYRWARLQGGKGRLMVAASIAAVAMLSGLWGIPGLDHLRKAYEAAYQAITGEDEDLQTELRQWVYEVSDSQWLSQVVSKGSLYPMGVDVSSRIGFQQILPEAGNFMDLMGVQGDLWFGRGQRAWEKYHQGRELEAAAELSPNFVKNPLTAWAWSEDGLKNSRGKQILAPEQMPTSAYWWKGAGFQPTIVREVRDWLWANSRLQTSQDKLKGRFLSRLADAETALIKNQDPAKVAALEAKLDRIWAELDAHNDALGPDEAPLEISSRSLNARIERNLYGIEEQLDRSRKVHRAEAERLQEVFGIDEILEKGR